MSDKFQRDLVDQILCYQNNLVLIAWLQGRTITVKLADTHKSKTVQMQSPAPMVPVPVPMAAAGYVQPGKAPVGSGTPVGYPYHQTVASYPASSYPNPPVAPAPYPTQSQVSYAPVSAKKELLGLSSTPPVGMGGYPYYYPKQ
jgi:heterogeneous nuclear ribonucleoprotein A1/A3